MRIFHVFEDLLDVFIAVKVGDLAIVQDVVDVLDKGFVDNLSIRKQEDMGLAVDTGRQEEKFDHVLTPLAHAIALGHFETDDIVASNERGKLRQRLAA